MKDSLATALWSKPTLSILLISSVGSWAAPLAGIPLTAAFVWWGRRRGTQPKLFGATVVMLIGVTLGTWAIFLTT